MSIGLLLMFGVTGEGGLQTARRAEAAVTTTTWTYPTSGGIQAGAGPSEATFLFVAAPCINCYITQIVPDLVYQDDPDPANHPNGTTANYNNNSLHNVWLHHMVVINSCNTTVRVFASGNERSTWTAPAGYGYFQSCASGWHVNYHVHNNSNVTRGVALKLGITYRTGETVTPLTPVTLDISNSADGEYTIPEGYSDTHSGSGAVGIRPDWTSTVQGSIVTMGGHVHDYGISVAAYNNRLGDYICTSTASYGTGSRYLPAGGPGTPGHPVAGNAVTLNPAYHEASGSPDNRHHIQAMTGCAPTSAQAILCIGDVIRLHTQYNNASSFPIFDAMGTMGVSVDTSLPDTNSNGTIDACEDNDGDGLRNSADNCPAWPNPAQGLPSWSVPAGDSDCDGFPDTVSVSGRGRESFMETDAADQCPDGSTDNAWPPDVNNSGATNLTDVVLFGPTFNKAPPNAAYNKRFDLNASNSVNLSDIVAIGPFFNKNCAP